MRVDDIQRNTLSIIIAKHVGLDPQNFRPTDDTEKGRHDAAHLLGKLSDRISYAALFDGVDEGDVFGLQMAICRQAVKLWHGDEIEDEVLASILRSRGTSHVVDNLAKSRVRLSSRPRTAGIRHVGL